LVLFTGCGREIMLTCCENSYMLVTIAFSPLVLDFNIVRGSSVLWVVHPFITYRRGKP
jgi:hypothetical protein